jgi:hypothetical protein
LELPYQIISEKVPVAKPMLELSGYFEEVDPVLLKEATQAADYQSRKELGDAYELVEMGDSATVECLLKELEVQDRLDTMIDRCLKRLLFARGIKSISAAPSAAPLKRVAGPSRAA